MALLEKSEPEELKHLEKECPHCQGVVLEVAIKCRHCGKLVDSFESSSPIPFNTPHHTKIENYMSNSLSVIFQFFGLLLIFVGFLGVNTIYWPLILFPFGIFFWMLGAMGARWKKCGNCGYTIAKKDISKCPRCYFEFTSS